MCTLRAGGKYFDIDAFLKKSTLQPCAIFRRGEPKFKDPAKKKRHTTSAMNISVSNASFENFRKQIKDAIQFLIKNKTEIKRLVKFKGIEGIELDFPTSCNRDKFIQNYFFPAELIALAAQLGLEIRISEYPESNEKTT